MCRTKIDQHSLPPPLAFGVVAPAIPHGHGPPRAKKKRKSRNKWGDSELTALLYHAAAIKELIKANANVLVICRGGNNRSRTLAGPRERQGRARE